MSIIGFLVACIADENDNSSAPICLLAVIQWFRRCTPVLAGISAELRKYVEGAVDLGLIRQILNDEITVAEVVERVGRRDEYDEN
jgi:hypothetical protein